MLFVNPDAHSNRDIPNLSLAYAATYFKSRVIDYNTLPEPINRLYTGETDILGVSIQSRSYSHANSIKRKYEELFPDATVKSINGFMDVLCCYPFLQWDDTLNFDVPFSDELPFPEYERFDSFDTFFKNWKSGHWHYPVVTSLGCPFLCTYCASRNRKWISRSPENCVKELKQAKEAIKAEAVELAMELAEKKLKEKLTKEEQEKLLEDSLTKIGGKG